jgi:hypothetical protein
MALLVTFMRLFLSSFRASFAFLLRHLAGVSFFARVFLVAIINVIVIYDFIQKPPTSSF